jgi:hypothetical protein
MSRRCMCTEDHAWPVVIMQPEQTVTAQIDQVRRPELLLCRNRSVVSYRTSEGGG